MKNIFGIMRSTYDKTPYIMVDNYNDALKIAAGGKEFSDDDAKQLIVKYPFLQEYPQSVDLADVSTLVETAIKATIAAIEMVAKETE